MSQSPSPRRGRFRFLYQFSLRSLLLATAAAAVFCNWYFQPKYHEEELAGKELRLRRQEKVGEPQPGRVLTVQEYLSLPRIVNHGNWSLLDDGNLTLARGRFIENKETGNWVAYYPTGGKAAEGKMQQGVRIGRWKSWYEDGTPASEVQFTPQPLSREKFVTHWNEFYVQIGCVGVPRREPIGGHLATEMVSCRDGRTIVWHPSGIVQCEGEYKLGLQHGAWKFYDQHGRVTESGPYRAGQRHGNWILTRSVSEGKTSVSDDTKLTRSVSERKLSSTQTVRYIDGRTQAELNDALDRLKPMLASGMRSDRYAALIDLADVGEGAASLLVEQLAHADAREQAAILGMVPRMPSGVNLLLPRVRELVVNSDQSVSHQARLTLFQLDRESRGKLFEPLLAEATSAPTLGLCLEELTILYRSDNTRRAAVFARLMELSLHRADADGSQIADAVGDLEGNVTSYLLAACEHREAAVRYQGLWALAQFQRGWMTGTGFVKLDDKTKEALLARLKKDPSLEVQRLTEDMERPPNFSGPSGSFGIGSGFTGGSSF